MLNLDGARYVVLSDELGSRLAFKPLVGTGTLRLVRKEWAIEPGPGQSRCTPRRSAVTGRSLP